VLTDDELAEELVRRGREILQATYSWDAIAGRTLAVYQEALAS
jgi:glycosyltransferase involved in cell wall biosynthesis